MGYLNQIVTKPLFLNSKFQREFIHFSMCKTPSLNTNFTRH